MGRITFCKIPNEEGTKFHNIKAEWLLQEFSISILHNASAWKGVVDSSEIKQLSKEHNTTVDEYMKECQVAFSGDGPEKFVYSLKNMGESAIVLTWKKTVASDIKIKFGSVCLRPEPLDRFMDEVWNVLENMSEELTQAKKATEEVEREKGMLFDRVKEYQELKLEMEKTLYAKFVLILNAKKKKIQELEAQLEEKACTHRTGDVEAPEDRVKSEPPAGEEVERRKEPVARTRKNAARGRGGRARGKPAAGSPRKAVEVISPLDILPPFQQPKEEEVGHGESGYNPGYDSDTDVDEPGPATSTTFRSNYNNDRRETAAAAAEVKAELPEPDSGSPTWDMVDDPPTPERDYSTQKKKKGAPSPPTRRSDSSSSTDIDEFLAQDDPLPLSTLPKRSRRTAANSWATTQSTSRVVLPAAAAPPAASTAKVDAHIFSTQDLLDDL